MDIKLIAVDLDGTLLNSKKELTARTKRALELAAEKGVYIVPSTGRTFGGIPEEIRSLPFVKYGICINGGNVWDKAADKALCKAEIPFDRAEEIFDFIERYGVMYDCYVNGWGKTDRKYFEHLEDHVDDPHVRKLIQATRVPVDNFRENLRETRQDIQKIILFYRDLEEHARVLKELPELLPDVNVSAALACNIELNHKNASKGIALKYLCEYLGFGLENAMACGDGGNDKEMIEAAGFAVVMENGTDQLKEMADFITRSNDEDGVAYAIEKFVLNQ